MRRTRRRDEPPWLDALREHATRCSITEPWVVVCLRRQQTRLLLVWMESMMDEVRTDSPAGEQDQQHR